MTASRSGTAISPGLEPAGAAGPGAPEAAPAHAAARPRRRTVWPYVAVVAVLAGAGAVAVALLVPPGQDAAGDIDGPVAVVTRGPLVVSVIETGEVVAEKRTLISNEIQWPVVIKSLVEEGEKVKKGDEIIVFECKELMDAIESKRLDVTGSRNAYLQAVESLALDRKEQDNLLRKSELAIQDANADLRRYIEAAGPGKIADANTDIQTARRDLALAEEKLNFKLKVNADKELNSPFSENEIEAEKLSVEKLNNALKKSISTYGMLIKYDNPRELRTLHEAVEDATLARARATHTARSKILTSEADRDTKKVGLDMKAKQLDEMLDDANKLVITAEEEGLVVYDTGSSRYRPVNVVVEVGAKISPRQQLMIIPDMTTLQIQTKVYEAIIDKVEPGLKTYVRFDSQADRTILAHIGKVAVLPDSQHGWFNPGVKVFKVNVELDERRTDLKPGTTAQVEIELERLENVLSVPVAAVFTEQEHTFCYRPIDGKPRRVPVKIGQMNDTRVEILEGLNEGDTLLLNPPASLRAPGKKKQKEKEEEAERPDLPPDGPPPGVGGARPEGTDGGGRKAQPEGPAGGERKARPEGPGGGERKARPGGGGGGRGGGGPR